MSQISNNAFFHRQLILLAALSGLTVLPAAHAEDKPIKPAMTKPTANANEVDLIPGSPQISSIKIEPVTSVPEPATEPLNGKIAFDENHTSRVSAPVAGRAMQILAQIGDTVKKGQTLLVIDSPDLGSAISDLKKAEADLQLKRQANERSKMLLEGGVIAKKELESTESDLKQAEAESQRARWKVSNLGGHGNANAENYAVKAPIGGIVVDRQINPGAEVRPDLAVPLFIISNADFLWATIDLPERDLGKVTVGQSIMIQVDAYPYETFSGKIQSIGGMIDPATRRIQVRCSVENAKGRLKPEMYARITPIANAGRQVIRLPNTALITEGLYSYVFVETSPGHLQKRRVSLTTQSREFSIVHDGLNLKERVVVSGAILLNSELAAGK